MATAPNDAPIKVKVGLHVHLRGGGPADYALRSHQIDRAAVGADADLSQSSTLSLSLLLRIKSNAAWRCGADMLSRTGRINLAFRIECLLPLVAAVILPACATQNINSSSASTPSAQATIFLGVLLRSRSTMWTGKRWVLEPPKSPLILATIRSRLLAMRLERRTPRNSAWMRWREPITSYQL
jgi:hypothetical protein